MALTAPAMTPVEIAACPLFAPPVRVTCYPCTTTLYVGETVPDGGAGAVFTAAGCPKGTCPGKDPAAYPPPPTVVDLTTVSAAPLPGPAPGPIADGVAVAVAATAVPAEPAATDPAS